VALPVGPLVNLLKDFISAPANAAHLFLLREKLTDADEQIEEMQQEMSRLRTENERLRADSRDSAVLAGIIQHDGVCWHRDENGRVEAIAFCPHANLR